MAGPSKAALKRATQRGDDDEVDDLPQEEEQEEEDDDEYDEKAERAAKARHRKRPKPSQPRVKREGGATQQTQQLQLPGSRQTPGSSQGRKATQRAAPSSASGVSLEWSADALQQLQAKLEQRTSAVGQAPPLDLGDAEMNALVAKVVRHVLFLWHEQPGALIPIAKLQELITTDYKEHHARRNLAKAIIPRAQEWLLRVMGLELREVTRQSAARTVKQAEDGAGTKCFVLRSALPPNVRTELLPQPHGDKGIPPGLTVTILAIIRLSGGKVDEETLWQWLEALGVAHDGQHPSLGKVKDHMAAMESCRYIVKGKGGLGPGMLAGGGAAGAGAGTYVYAWGECATEEVGNDAIDAFIKKVVQMPGRSRGNGRGNGADGDDEVGGADNDDAGRGLDDVEIGPPHSTQPARKKAKARPKAKTEPSQAREVVELSD